MVYENEGHSFIQVGVTALRDPATGEFLPSVPLYIDNAGGAAEAETAAMIDVAGVLARHMRDYVDANGRLSRRKETSKASAGKAKREAINKAAISAFEALISFDETAAL